MATYVVDASVVIERLIRGSYTANVQAMFTQLKKMDTLLVPEFCLLECTNLLWKHVRFQGMLLADAEILLKDLRSLPIKRVPAKAALNHALRIGLTHQLAVYDSAYIALAKRSGHPLITIDMPRSRAAASERVILNPITDFK